MMLFAQAMNVPPTTTGTWALGFAGFAVGLGGILWCWNQLMRALGKEPKRSIAPQPLTIEIAKQLHEQFADKRSFEDHVKGNTKRHAEIFNEIDRVEREAREAMDTKFSDLAIERRDSLEKLNNQFTFIRENVAAINRELQIRNK